MSLTANYLQAARINISDMLPKIKNQASNLTIAAVAASAFALTSTSLVLESAPQETTDKPTEWYTSEYPHENREEPETIIRGEGVDATIQPGGLPYIYAVSPTLIP